jgi:nicotinic acetylcholine receptor
MYFYCSADGDFHVKMLTKAKVEYNGQITWEPPAIYKSYCPIDIEFFPFDIQECFLKFGIWSYGFKEVDLQHMCSDKAVYINDTDEAVIDRGIDITDVYPNAEWDIINVTARRKEKIYTCCANTTYIDITFNVTFRRRILFYSLNLIMPCVSISGLAVLVFYLPSDSCEKITLSISVLLALSVFFLLLSDIMPPTSFVVPMIGKYLLFTMSVVTLSIFLTVYTLGINFRRPSTGSMSPWVKLVFTELLPKILFIKRPTLDFPDMIENKKIQKCNGINRSGLSTLIRDSFCHDTKENSPDENLAGNAIKRKYPPEISLAFDGVKYIANTLKDEEKEYSVSMIVQKSYPFIGYLYNLNFNEAIDISLYKYAW